MPDVIEPAAGEPAAPEPAVARPRRRLSRRGGLVAGVVALVVVMVVAVVALSAGGTSGAPPNAAAAIVPADALAYVNLAVDGDRPAVKQALKVAARFPDFPLVGGAGLTRFAAAIAGGRSVDYAREIRPWLGDEASLALLNTETSTAGTLLILRVRDAGRAQAFLRSVGATGAGSYRGTSLQRYPNGNELAIIAHFLILGQAASVRAAIDAGTGHAPSLAADPTYRRASAGQPVDRVLDAYASLAGVRRLLADQAGAVGALGSLLYQPALQGVALAVTPTAQGLTLKLHDALDPTLARVNSTPTTAFTPTLQAVMPAGSSLMFDVTGLDHVAPRVLNAGASAGVAGGIGPLLSRLGTALKSEGVNVADIVSIFDKEAAVAIVPHGSSPTLVIVARTPDQSRIQTELAQLEVPLSQLFAPAGKGSQSAPVFNDRTVDGVTAHQLALTTGLQLDYAVFHGLVVISTGLPGIAAVAQRSHSLAVTPAFRAVLGQRPRRVTSLVYADPSQLLNLGSSTGLTGASTISAVESDLRKIAAIGLVSARSGSAASDSTTQVTIQVPAH